MSESSRYAELRDYLLVLRRNKLLIVAVTLLFGGAALWYSLRLDPVYRAESAVLFQDPRGDIDELGGSNVPRQTAVERAAIGAETVGSEKVLKAVAKRLRTGNLGASVSPRVESRSTLVVIQVESEDPKRASKVANVFAEETRRVARRDLVREVNRKLRSIRPQIRAIRRLNEPTAVAQQLQLQGRLRALRVLGEPATVARKAGVPVDPISPQPVRNGLLGLLAGLTVALLIAFTRDSLDRRLRTVSEVSETSTLPLLGRLREDSLGKVDEVDLEAVRILRTNLDFLDVDHPVSSVLVTSPLPEEGKSTVAVSLASAFALAGRRTLLIECDLRRPVLADRLGLKEAPGLSDYLAGHANAEAVLQPVGLVEPPSPNGGKPAADSDLPPLSCITAGTKTPRPAELLGSSGFGDLLGVLARAYDAVVMDASPLLPVGDTLELVQYADRVVLCARARQTSRDQLRAAVAALEQLPPRPSGVMVTGLRKRDEQQYGSYAYAGGPESTFAGDG